MSSFRKDKLQGNNSGFKAPLREGPTLGLLLLVVLFGVELKSWARTEVEIRETIEEVLMQRHPTETRNWWRSLGPNAASIVISIFNIENNIYRQIRLVDALAAFEDPATLEFLKDQAAHHSNVIVRRAAIRAIGLSQGIKEKDYLKQHLESADPHTRLATSKLLHDLKDPAADKIVNEFQKNEKVDWISTSLKNHRLLKGKNGLLEGKRKL